MTHRATSSFFYIKRDWSKRKDLVLGHYLAPYLPKIATQRRPILLVDGFAGPGRFRDGNPGSPQIICDTVEKARAAGLGVPVEVLCIEKEKDLFADLQSTVGARAVPRNGSFQENIDEIERRARQESVFLYLDPYTVSGLHLAELARMFRALQTGSSVEILMNFNGFALARIAASLLGESPPDLGSEEVPELSAGGAVGPSDINLVLGGDWWREILQRPDGFPAKVRCITDGYCARLRTHFNEVCSHDVYERSTHKIPKYTLVFGSRHPDSLELMNDAMVKSQRLLAEAEAPEEPTLFETRSEALVPDYSKLPAMVLATAGSSRLTRRTLMNSFVRRHLGVFLWKEIRGAIEELLKNGMMTSATGKTRINDGVIVFATHSS